MLTMILEDAPRGQSVTEVTHTGGDFVIGRNSDTDWQFDDPDMYVSRKHCIISGDADGYTVTDASTGGLFIDGATTPLGAGNTAKLEHDMRLRLGNFVIRIDLGEAGAVRRTVAPVTASADSNPFDDDGFFDVPDAVTTPKVRPKDLPDPFETGSGSDGGAAVEVVQVRPQFDDDFNLEPERGPVPASRPSMDFDFGPEAEVKETPVAEVDTVPEVTVKAQSETGLRDAFFEGLGLDPAQFNDGDPEAQMRQLGARYRMLGDGLFHLLRTRAKEKNNARVAQTQIANRDVNPLKFAANTSDAVASLVAQRSEGYLDPDRTIVDSFRDLTEHQIRSWNAIQVALRRMVDQFDPEEFEQAMEEHSLLEQLIAGGRNAKLWQLYEERYKEIAASAETKFLGEVGADFREAYEASGGRRHD